VAILRLKVKKVHVGQGFEFLNFELLFLCYNIKIMEDSVKVILKKLDEIDSRLKSIEGVKTASVTTQRVSETKDAKIERDPLFSRALEMMDKFDEMSSKQLVEALKIDLKRAETILDQLETAGLGTCYMKEV